MVIYIVFTADGNVYAKFAVKRHAEQFQSWLQSTEGIHTDVISQLIAVSW